MKTQMLSILDEVAKGNKKPNNCTSRAIGFIWC
jgi:hypothetical protein